VRVRPEEPGGRALALGQGERLAVGGVGAHGDHEGVVVVGLDQPCPDDLVAATAGRLHTVRAIDHLEGLMVKEDRRQLLARHTEQDEAMLLILVARSGTIAPMNSR
jgi:hypothetical protein